MSANLARHIESVHTGNVREMHSNVRRLRLLSRRRLSIHAVATTSDRQLRVELRNISQSGAGMRIDGSVTLDEPLTLHFADGRTIDAFVRWTRSYFCGVEFSQLLPFDDPLLGDLTPPVAIQRSAPVNAQAAPSANDVTLQSIPAGANAAKALKKAVSTAISRLTGTIVTAQIRNRIRSEARMIARAVRKQGNAWLVDAE